MKKLLFLLLLPILCNGQFKVSADGKTYTAPVEYMYEHLTLIVERDSCRTREVKYNQIIDFKNVQLFNNTITIGKLQKKVKVKNIIIPIGIGIGFVGGIIFTR